MLSQEEDVVAVRVWLQGVVSGRCGGRQGVVTGCCLRKTWWPSGCGYRVLSQEDVVAIRVWLQGGWNCAAAPQHSTKME